MGSMTSEDRCYCEARGTCAIAESAHSIDGQSHISRPLLLPPTLAMGSMTSEDRCYYRTHGTRTAADIANSRDGPYDISGPLLLWDT
jgi:hypothetical protein